ncbi:hypothetical protein [Xanthomonas arboricola]|uniref:Uncharacterized protein n=1 Tax=Xanthomonas arboricola TaxID=56448 RepID=A0AB73H272_9XANT|nr:hypothetical protein [Xanthomonas arboricola]MBB5672293.1 hypothetical protein [Xanthomonas arboricola]
MSKVTQLHPASIDLPPPPPPTSFPEAAPEWVGSGPIKSGLLDSLVVADGDMDQELIDVPAPPEDEVPEEAPVDAPAPPIEARSSNLDGMDPQVANWVHQLTAFAPGELVDEDRKVAEAANKRWGELVLRGTQLDSVYDVEEATERVLPAKLVSKFKTALLTSREKSDVDLRSAVLNGEQAKRDAGEPEHPQWHSNGGGGGSTIVDSLVKAPFTMMSAGGSMVMEGLRAAQKAVGGVVDQRRKTAFDVLGKQVHSIEAQVSEDANWLRAHGLGQIADELKASGLTPSDAVGEMKRGGKLERLGLQLKGMMLEPEVQQRVDAVQSGLNQYADKADRYAKAGAAIDRDPAEVLEPSMDRLQDAVGDLPVADKEGKFENLGEKLREISEKIRALIERLMDKFMPRGP